MSVQKNPWSSHRALAGIDPAPEWLSTTQTLAQFGPDRSTQHLQYRSFVDAGAGISRAPWEDAAGQILIGSSAWVARMRSVLESRPRSSDHPTAQRYASRPRPARIIDVVAEVFGTTGEAIRNAHGTVERRLVAWLGCYESMARLGSIAPVLRIRSTSRVSALIAQCDRDLRESSTLRVAADACLERLRRELVPERVAHREIVPSIERTYTQRL